MTAGRPGRRRIHLREISGDSEAPLETVGQDLRAARLRRGDEICATVSPGPEDPQGSSGSAGGRRSRRPAGQDLCDRLCPLLCRAIWAWTRPRWSNASSRKFPAATTSICPSRAVMHDEDDAPPAVWLAHRRGVVGAAADLWRLASAVGRTARPSRCRPRRLLNPPQAAPRAQAGAAPPPPQTARRRPPPTPPAIRPPPARRRRRRRRRAAAKTPPPATPAAATPRPRRQRPPVPPLHAATGPGLWRAEQQCPRGAARPRRYPHHRARAGRHDLSSTAT